MNCSTTWEWIFILAAPLAAASGDSPLACAVLFAALMADGWRFEERWREEDRRFNRRIQQAYVDALNAQHKEIERLRVEGDEWKR